MGGAMEQQRFGGDWTLIKLGILGEYLRAFTTALKNQPFRLVYIDAFAGTGRCKVNTSSGEREVDGSARIALRVNPPFDQFVFIEE